MSDPLWLCVDLGSNPGSLSLFTGTPEAPTRYLSEVVLPNQSKHAERFIDSITGLLSGDPKSLREVKHIVTSGGPGSFTGLRVALSSLKALSHVLECPLTLVNGAEARAHSFWLKEPNEKEVSVVTHLTATQVLVSGFQVGAEQGLTNIAEHVHTQLEVTSLSGRVLWDVQPLPLEKFVYYPLTSRHLAESWKFLRSKKTARSWEEWVQLAPDYWGSTRFD